MNDADFDALPRTKDGLPVVTLMGDPDMSGPDAFLSLVDKGANGRKIKAVKAADVATTANDADKPKPGANDDEEEMDADGKPKPKPKAKAKKAEDLQPIHEVALHLGTNDGETRSWWRSLFGMMIGSPPQDTSTTTMVSKGEVDFEEAVAVPRVFKALDEGWGALDHTIWSIMHDDDVRNKQEAVEVALTAFARFVSAAFDSVPVMKAEQALAVKAITAKLHAARKRDHDQQAINAPDMAMISEAQETLRALSATLSTMATKAAPPNEDQNMNPEQIAQVAELAAQSAVKATKTANPNATAAEIVQAGEAARMEVFKVAVAGPAQPGIPTTVLKDQIRESQGMNGKAKDPMTVMTAAINSMTSLTRKMAVGLGLDPETGDVAELAADGSNAGLAHVVKKQGEAIAHLSGTVKKHVDTPAASNQGDGEAAAETARVLAAKSASGVDWSGTALGNF